MLNYLCPNTRGETDIRELHVSARALFKFSFHDVSGLPVSLFSDDDADEHIWCNLCLYLKLKHPQKTTTLSLRQDIFK